jgi:DNA end-binding protein Ku
MRSIWSGSISFGLVNIPVKLGSAIESTKELDFDMLSKKDMAPIRYARIDTETGKEVAWKDIVKGYQYAKGKYVVITDEDFAKASPEKSKTIDLIQFVKEEEIDPIYYDKPYYITPDKGASKSYQLLLKALEESGTVGLAEFMLRNRMHICVIKPYNGVLLINQLRYDEEVREVPEVTKSEKITQKEVQLAVKLIDQLTEKFDPAAFKDTYVAELKKVIKAKAAGKNIRIADEPKKPTGTVKDLMEELKKSLEGGSKKKRA